MRLVLQSGVKQKTQGNPQGPHGDSLGIENYSFLGDAVPIFALSCLQTSGFQSPRTQLNLCFPPVGCTQL